MTLRNLLTWRHVLNKRFLKKPAFLVILLLTPLLLLAFRFAAAQDSGVLTIALCPVRDDAFSAGIVQKLQEEPSVLRWLVFDEPEDARAAVANGSADAAWIFDENAQTKLAAQVPALTLVEREETVFLRLAREKLYAALYPSLAYVTYSEFLQEKAGGVPLDENELTAYYERTVTDQPIIVQAGADGATTVQEENYLLSPMRGLLSLLVMLSALAAACFLQQDRRRGVLTRVGRRETAVISAIYLLMPALDTAAVVFAALLITGLAGNVWYELLLLALLALSGAGFSAVISLLCKTPERTGAASLLLTLCMLVLCPVFLDLHVLRGAAYLFPPLYYLHAARNLHYCLYLAGYTAIVWALAALLSRRKA